MLSVSLGLLQAVMNMAPATTTDKIALWVEKIWRRLLMKIPALGN